MNNYFKKIENFIFNNYINNYPNELKNKFNYLIENGKRLRPILCIIFSNFEYNKNIIINHNIYNINNYYLNNNNNNNSNIIYNIATSIEIIHSLSLVLDDLPEMDNDIMRRNKDSFHIKYGIEYTNFFIYYMFNKIGLILDDSINLTYTNNINKNELILLINIFDDIKYLFQRNLNVLIDGQYNDLEFGNSIFLDNNINIDNEINNYEYIKEKDIIIELLNNNIDNHKLTKIITLKIIDDIELNINLNLKKTSSLFTLSITIGYFLQLFNNKINYVDNEEYTIIYEHLNTFGNILGYIFQISDDILDYEDDIKNNNPNICSILDTSIVLILLKNGCNWLYINAIYIKQLMENINNEKDIINNDKDIINIEKYIRNNDKDIINNEINNKDYICLDDNRNHKLTFDIKAVNEIIENIENRINKFEDLQSKNLQSDYLQFEDLEL